MLTKDGAYTESDTTPCAEVSLATQGYLVVLHNNLKHLVYVTLPNTPNIATRTHISSYGFVHVRTCYFKYVQLLTIIRMFACFVSSAQQEKETCVVQGTAEKHGRFFQHYLHR